MIPVDEALAHIEREVTFLPTIKISFEQALGLVLAEDIFADEPMPPFPASAVDGYAVIASDGPGRREIIGEQMAGYVAEVEILPGTAARVMTGAPIPPGANAMIMVEDTTEHEGQVNILSGDIQIGQYIRPVGLDIEQGQLVLAKGTILNPAELGLLATVGKTEINVYRRPVIAVMSTGDEIVEPHQSPGRGQIRDANRFTLINMVKQTGAIPVDMGIIQDKQHGVQDSIEAALNKADMLLTSGGVSMGQLDLVKPYLASRGTIHFGRVNTKPGKPVTFATALVASEKKICFALPGFPVSAMVCFEIFVRPAILKMMGHTKIHRPRQRVILGHDFRHDPNRTEFQRVVIIRQDDGILAQTLGDGTIKLTASSTGFQGSGRLLSMVGANGLVILPHGQGDYEAGSVVEAIIF